LAFEIKLTYYICHISISTDLRPTRAGVASLSLQQKFGSFQRVYQSG